MAASFSLSLLTGAKGNCPAEDRAMIAPGVCSNLPWTFGIRPLLEVNIRPPHPRCYYISELYICLQMTQGSTSKTGRGGASSSLCMSQPVDDSDLGWCLESPSLHPILPQPSPPSCGSLHPGKLLFILQNPVHTSSFEALPDSLPREFLSLLFFGGTLFNLLIGHIVFYLLMALSRPRSGQPCPQHEHTSSRWATESPHRPT